MREQDSRLKKFVHWIAPNAIWDVIKWLGGSSMIASFGHLLWWEFHRNKADWYSIAAYFVVGIFLIALATILQHRSDSGSEKVHPVVLPHEVASANLPDFLDLKPYPLELILSEHSADPASVNFIFYRDRLVFKLQNKWDTEIDVYKPFWQSQEVSAQAPLYARFYNVGDKDVSDNGRGEEKGIDVVHLPPNGIVSGWLGLLQPTRGDGLAVRARERNTGTMIFPIKVAGKMRFAWVKV